MSESIINMEYLFEKITDELYPYKRIKLYNDIPILFLYDIKKQSQEHFAYQKDTNNPSYDASDDLIDQIEKLNLTDEDKWMQTCNVFLVKGYDEDKKFYCYYELELE